tara:strand:- start:1705 stop:1971 length:267 start_codon:yes stop_codon:yes gene_type:complete
MENQHRKIKGYRELSQEEIYLMNRIKDKGAEIEQLVKQVQQLNSSTDDEDFAELVRRSEAFLWSAIAKTDIQTGIMALTRAVAKPEFF